MLVLALADLDVLLRAADIAGAMTTEALLGTDRAFAEDLVGMRPQLGQAVSAANLRALLAGSAIVASHRVDDDRVQDAYSLRCTPQVHGAARDTVEHARGDRRARAGVVHRQPGRAARRPGRVVRQLPRCAGGRRRRLPGHLDRRRRRRSASGGPTACSTASRSHGLPPFLAPDAGVNSGSDDRPVHPGGDGGREPPPGRPGEHRHDVDQRHAGGPRLARLVGGPQAARRRGQPGPHPGRRADRRVAGASTCAARWHPRPGRGAAAAAVLAASGGPGPDEWLAPRLAAVERLVADGSIVNAAESAVGTPLR